MSTVYAADLYCGAGGASAGLFAAARKLGAQVRLVAVNHWEVAIETHSANYPGALHLCNDVEKVSPREAVPAGRLTLLLAGPSCVHFSQARGGRPVSDQQRSGAWEVVHWARDLYIENILVENVPEFLSWGPLTEKGQPCKERSGLYFRQWVRMLTDLGYTVEWRVLNAAHYGDATTRKRLFIQARRSGRIVWPRPTHMPPDDMTAYADAKPWRAAREIIDWDLPSQSIFTRKKPLAPNTLKRIMAGLNKFCGLPFILPHQHGSSGPENVRSVETPLPTITGTSSDIFLAHPFLVILRNNCDAQDLDQPAPTICANGNHLGLCQPFLVGIGGPRGAQKERSIEEPLGTLLGQNHTGVVQPFLVRYNGGDRSQSLDNPLTTLDTSNRFGLVQPFLVSYYGNGGAQSVDDPLDTITARDRFGLVEGGIIDKGDQLALLDIHFRMLQPHELAAAHSFPADYQFAGGREQKVRQIGNSWPCRLSEALCTAILSDGRAQ